MATNRVIGKGNPLPRDVLAQFLPDERSIRAFENMGADLLEIAQILEDLEENAAIAAARVSAVLATAVEQQKEIFDARIESLKDDTRELLARLSEIEAKDDFSLQLSGLVSQLQAQQNIGDGVKIKRIINNASMTFTGVASQTYTITPALGVAANAVIIPAGYQVGSGTPDFLSTNCTLVVTNTTTVTGSRGGTGADLTVRFQIIEFEP